MSNLREAAQQALEALDSKHDTAKAEWRILQYRAFTALRAALEQDQNQTPVAKIRTWHRGGEQNAELWDWDVGVETLPDGEHLLYASAHLRAALEQDEPEGVVCARCGALAFDPVVSQRKPLTEDEK